MDYFKRATVVDYTALDLNCPRVCKGSPKLKRKCKRKARRKLKQRLNNGMED